MRNDEKIDILVVDDLPEKLLVIETILESLGQNIVKARSGREALRLLLDREFAVILLDVYMPDMNGLETAAMIRSRRQTADTPIIFITAFADEGHTAEGYSLGAVDYITSPVVPEILRTKVGVFVDLYRKTQQVRRQAEERVALAREQAARVAAEEETRRSAFLAEASQALTRSLDYDATLRGLLRLLVPSFGDLVAVVVVDDDSGLWQVHSAWHDPTDPTGDDMGPRSFLHDPGATGGSPTSANPGLAPALVDEPPVAPGGGNPSTLGEGDLAPGFAALIRRVLDSGTAEFLPGPSPGLEGGLVVGRCIGDPKSMMVIPLEARGGALGAIALATGPSGRSFGVKDLKLAEDLASRAAIAIINARLYRNIQEDDRRKNEFLAMLAHELRNPLAPIRNAVEILRQLNRGEGELGWASDVIGRQVEQMVRLVDDLLDISRITGGKIQLRKEPSLVAPVVSSAIETSRPLIEGRNQTLEVSLPAEPLWVEADRARLGQVLANLLNNAAKYTGDGGRIGIDVRREGPDAVFRVSDTGVGIPPEMISRVFDLFTQVDRSLDRSEGGLGIGLTLVRRLIEMHGGSVQARSDGPGLGSEFILRLPALESPALLNGVHIPALADPIGRAMSAADDGRVGPSPLRIMIVDDNEDSARSLARLLRFAGHEVDTAGDGPSALEQIEANPPDVVLLDIGLPGMDGYEVARTLRTRPGPCPRLVVALTGYGRDEDRARSRDAGFDRHFVKPVELESLLSLLDSHRTAIHENRNERLVPSPVEGEG
jgi:signal transduction histidine kinase/DNA-binding response OmpR family regulator